MYIQYNSTQAYLHEQARYQYYLIVNLIQNIQCKRIVFLDFGTDNEIRERNLDEQAANSRDVTSLCLSVTSSISPNVSAHPLAFRETAMQVRNGCSSQTKPRNKGIMSMSSNRSQTVEKKSKISATYRSKTTYDATVWCSAPGTGDAERFT